MTNRAPLQGRTKLARQVEERMIAREQGLPIAERKSRKFATPSHDTELSLFRRTREYRLLNTIWRNSKYVTPTNVGGIVEHRWQNETLTRAEWEEKYFDEVLPYASFNMLTNRIQEEAEEQVRRYRWLINKDMDRMKISESEREGYFARLSNPSKQSIVDAAYLRIIIQSNNGFILERKALKMWSKSDASLRRATQAEDEGGHIDLIGDTVAYQVKPETFLGVSTEGLRDDQISNLRAQLAYEAKSGKKVYYVFQDDILANSLLRCDLKTVAFNCGLIEKFMEMTSKQSLAA